MATEFPPYKIQKVADLIPSVLNARTHTDAQVEQIARSIREFGFTNPVLTDGEKGVVAGHGRLLAAKRLGMLEVPTVELSHLTPEQKRAYMLADNQLALNAGWDEALLRVEINALRDAGFDIDLTGFSEREIDQLFVGDVDPTKLWAGMPEFNQPNAFAFRSIVVHFKDSEGVAMFKEAVNQPEITDVTKFIWFPPVPEESYMDRHYVTDGEGASEANEQEEAEAAANRARKFKRAVQLLYPAEDLPGFMEKVRLLSERFGTENISETVAKAIETLSHETADAKQ